jgi:hypothetical protein
LEALGSLGIHTLLQHLSAHTLLHFSGGVVEDQAGCVWVNTVPQTKIVQHIRETIKFAQLRKK